MSSDLLPARKCTTTNLQEFPTNTSAFQVLWVFLEVVTGSQKKAWQDSLACLDPGKIDTEAVAMCSQSNIFLADSILLDWEWLYNSADLKVVSSIQLNMTFPD